MIYPVCNQGNALDRSAAQTHRRTVVQGWISPKNEIETDSIRLCRQVFVLDTYHNCYNRIMNQSILVFTFVGSIAYVTVLLLLVVRSIFWAACWLLPSQPTYNLILLKSVQSVSGVPNSSPWDSWKWSSDRLVMSGHMLRQV